MGKNLPYETTILPRSDSELFLALVSKIAHLQGPRVTKFEGSVVRIDKPGPNATADILMNPVGDKEKGMHRRITLFSLADIGCAKLGARFQYTLYEIGPIAISEFSPDPTT